MNPEAVTDAYNMFTDTGYDGDQASFEKLLSTNPEALKDSFGQFTSTGYNGSIEDFKILLGVNGDVEETETEVEEEPSQEGVAPAVETTEEVVADPTIESVDTELAEEKAKTFDEKSLAASKARKKQIEELKEDIRNKKNKDLGEENKPKDLDYKKVEITDARGNVTVHSYASIYNRYGDVNAYIKRFTDNPEYGSAKLIDDTPEDIKEELAIWRNSDNKAAREKEYKEKQDLLKKLEKEEKDRYDIEEDFNARNEHKDQLLSAKILSKKLNSIGENSDRSKKIAADTLFGDIQRRIESDTWGTFGQEDDILIMGAIDKDPESEKAKEYMQKYFNNDPEFYEKYKQYSASGHDDFDFDYIKNISPRTVQGAIRKAKEEEQELFFIDKEYTTDQRRITNEFLADEIEGPLSAQELRYAYGDQFRTIKRDEVDPLTGFRTGKQEVVKIPNRKVYSKYANDGEGGMVSTGKDDYSGVGFTKGKELYAVEASKLKLKNAEFKLEEQDYLNREKQFNDENGPTLEKLTAISDKVKSFQDNGISADSSPEDIAEYNKLIEEYGTITNEFDLDAVNDQQRELANDFRSLENKSQLLMDQSAKLGDLTIAANVAVKDFSSMNRFHLQLEKAFIGDTAMSLASIQKGVANVLEATGVINEDSRFYKRAEEDKYAAVNYNRDLNEQLSEDFVMNITSDDATWGNLDTYMAQMFANNSPSILATVPTLLSGGVGGMLKAGSSLSGRLALREMTKKASLLSQAAFFNMGYGGTLADLEIALDDAEGRKSQLQKEIDNPELYGLTEYDIAQNKLQIVDLDRVMSKTQWHRSTNAFAAGSIEMISERLGSLSYVSKLSKFSAASGSPFFKRAMYNGINTSMNLGTELAEETFSTIFTNGADIVLMGEDKSMFEGLDKDFVINTAFTSLAIQGPQIGGNAYNLWKDELTTTAERKMTDKRRVRMFEITEALQDRTKLTRKEQADLVQEQRDIMEAEAWQDAMSTNKINRLSKEEQKALFDLNRQRRVVARNARSEAAKGDSKTAQQRKNKYAQEFKRLSDQRESLLTADQRRREKKAAEGYTYVDKETGQTVEVAPVNEVQRAFNMGLYDFYSDVTEMNQMQNGNAYEKFDGEPNAEYLKNKYGEEAANELMASYERGSNAANIGNDIFIFQENINRAMMNGNLITESEVAAVAPMHELLHIQNKKAGIVKDGVVVGQANEAIKQFETVMKTKLATKKITQEQYDNFIARKKLYTKESGVNVEELLNLYGDFISIGALTQSDFNYAYGIKSTLSTLVNKFNPSEQAWLVPMTKSSDVYSYLQSFQKSAKDKLNISIDDDEDKNVKESSNLAEMSKDFDMSKPSGRTRFLNETLAKDKNGNFVTDIAKSKFGQDIGGMIESTTRRLYDKVPEDLRKGVTRDDFKNDLTTMASTLIQQEFDPSKQSIDKFLSNRLNLRANKLATDTFDQEFTDDITEAKDVAAEETADIVKEDNKKIDQSQRGIKLGNRLVTNPIQQETLSKAKEEIKKEIDNLPIESLDFKSLKNVVTDRVQELFGIKPKAGNLTKGDVSNAQNFINKNVEALMTMLPEGATRSGTSTGVQKVLLDKLYKKTKRVAMSVSGSKAGLAVQEKRNDITQSQFKEIFGITPAGTPNVSDRNTSARIKALVAQAERMLTNQEVRSELEKQGRDVPQALAEGKAQVMFSESLNKVTPEQRKLYDKLSNARSINDIAKILNLGDVTVNDKNRVGKQIALLEAIQEYNLSSNVFKAAMPASSGAVRMRVGKVPTLDKYLADNNIKGVKGDVWYKLTNGKFAKGVYKGTDKNGNKKFTPPVNEDGVPLTNLVAQRGRLYYGVTDPAYITALAAAETRKDNQKPKRIRVKGKITPQEYNKNKPQSDMNMDILEDVSKQLGNAVKDGMNPAIAALLIAQGYQATTGLIKIAARFDNVSDVMEYGKSKKQRTGEKYREEHNPPASVIGATLIGAIVNKNVDEIFPFIRKNYSQTQLSKASDELLDMAKLDATIPTGYSIFNNPLIRLAMAGINGNTITNLTTGNSMMEDYGLPVPSKFKNNTAVVDFQNKLVAEVESGKTIEDAKAELDAFLPLADGIQESANENVSLLSESKVLNVNENMSPGDILSKAKTIDEALANARKTDKPTRKIRVFDFDDTLAQTNSIVFYTKKDGSQGELTAEQFASDGARLVQEGAVMDFSDFDIVRDGKRGPLFKVAETIKNARGNEDLYVLTARSPQAQEAIYEFLKSEGLEFKKENIVGLGNSSGEAKANWIIDKAAEGFNDFYFADDAYQNVRAVQDALSVIDVKSQVQQAHVSESKNLNSDFNRLIENTTGIGKQKKYSKAKAEVVGANKGKGKFWIPYSAEDFQGLIYKTLAKGSLGDAQMAWYKQHVLDPYARAMDNFSTARLNLMRDFNTLKKKLNVPANLRKKTDSGFTNEQAVRVYLWNKTGKKVPGLSNTDLKELSDIVEKDPQLKVFADELLTITKGDGYSNPGQNWLVGTITTDLLDLLNTTKRDKFLEQWQNNVDQIYNEDNLNKLESIYGAKYREALENVLSRMKSGKNRLASGGRLSNKILDYINASNGAIMFFNMRSAVLQTISSINFMNWSFNNPIQAGKAFANQPQYWSDFKKLMNSDFLLDRRNGLRINISESEIADAAKTSKNKAKAVLNYILQKGYLPTQYADSFAIASGGATFYRNRISDLMEQGKSVKEAEAQAMQEFREIAEENQQSSRPDKVSQQQSSDAGRLILMFANTPMQYARIQKRAFQDLVNGRGDRKTNISKIIYYGVVQNIIFNALQQAVFALGFGDGDDDAEEKKYLGIANGMLDSTLRGLGMGGTAVSVIKNFLYDIYERSDRSRPEYVDSVWKLLQFSPPISSKISRMRQALWLFDSKKRRQEMFDKGFSLDNPAYDAFAKVLSAGTNIPLDRVLQKFDNISSAMNEETDWWQSVAMILGWPEWQLKEGTKKIKPALQSSRAGSRRGGRSTGRRR